MEQGVLGEGRLDVLREFAGVLLPTGHSGSRQCQGDQNLRTHEMGEAHTASCLFC